MKGKPEPGRLSRAIVTGCAGFVGSHLTERLLSDGVDVIGIDCFNDNYGREAKVANLEAASDWDCFDFLPIDLSKGDLGSLLDGCDALFHLAAEPGVRASWGPRFEAYVRNNVLATHLLLEAARESGIRFVYASSSSVYGQAESYPTDELTLPRPFSPYGVTKLAAEQLCSAYHENFGVETTSLRFFTVYGPRQRPDMAFTRFLRALLEGEPIMVYGDGRQSRDFTYVDDIVDALLASAVREQAIGGVFNLGGGTQIEVNEILDLMSEITGRSPEVMKLDAQAGDVRITGADTTRARSMLGFDPRTSISEGISRQYEWVTSTAGKS